VGEKKQLCWLVSNSLDSVLVSRQTPDPDGSDGSGVEPALTGQDDSFASARIRTPPRECPNRGLYGGSTVDGTIQ
jgi:hypothetical protein